jgi:uncharacterized membrane protein YdjX (TVP38/TMEM64 family)
MPPARRLIPRLVLFLLLVAVIVVPIVVWGRDLWNLVTSGSRLREWITSWGPWAPLVFAGIMALQTVVFVVPGEPVQFAAGYLFGAWWGVALAVAGSAVGATVCFFVARLLGKPFVAAIVPKERMAATERLLGSPSARSIFFLLYLIPGIPKDVLGYVAGISPLTYVFFITVSTLGRLPGLVGSAIIGGAAASRKWVVVGILSGVAVALFAAGLLLRPRVQAWLERKAARGTPDEPGAPTRS